MKIPTDLIVRRHYFNIGFFVGRQKIAEIRRKGNTYEVLTFTGVARPNKFPKEEQALERMSELLGVEIPIEAEGERVLGEEIPMDTPVRRLGPFLSFRAIKALMQYGDREMKRLDPDWNILFDDSDRITLEHVVYASRDDLANTPNVGEVTLKEILEFIEAVQP